MGITAYCKEIMKIKSWVTLPHDFWLSLGTKIQISFLSYSIFLECGESLQPAPARLDVFHRLPSSLICVDLTLPEKEYLVISIFYSPVAKRVDQLLGWVKIFGVLKQSSACPHSRWLCRVWWKSFCMNSVWPDHVQILHYKHNIWLYVIYAHWSNPLDIQLPVSRVCVKHHYVVSDVKVKRNSVHFRVLARWDLVLIFWIFSLTSSWIRSDTVCKSFVGEIDIVLNCNILFRLPTATDGNGVTNIRLSL